MFELKDQDPAFLLRNYCIDSVSAAYNYLKQNKNSAYFLTEGLLGR